MFPFQTPHSQRVPLGCLVILVTLILPTNNPQFPPVVPLACWVVIRAFLNLLLILEHKTRFPIIRLPEYLISTVLFARQDTSYTHTHTPMETSFHPSLTFVPSLANYSHSLYTPPSLGSPSFTTPFPSFHFLAVQREHLSVPLFLCFHSFSLWITFYWFYLWLFFIELCHSDLIIHSYIIFPEM